MTNDAPRDPMHDAIMRMIDESRAIDPKLALEGIRARRLPPRNRKPPKRKVLR